jgi:hypothetical protein
MARMAEGSGMSLSNPPAGGGASLSGTTLSHASFSSVSPDFSGIAHLPRLPDGLRSRAPVRSEPSP